MKAKPDYQLAKPDPKRDAPFVVEWFNGSDGKATLLAMGNPEASIIESTIEGEQLKLTTFVELEAQNKQLTWMIRADDKTIGVVWINLEETDSLEAPAVHIMIGNVDYRGRGIGRAAIKEMISYAYRTLPFDTLYSRHLVSNTPIAKIFKKLGFEPDEKPYVDETDYKWQNVKLVL